MGILGQAEPVFGVLDDVLLVAKPLCDSQHLLVAALRIAHHDAVGIPAQSVVQKKVPVVCWWSLSTIGVSLIMYWRALLKFLGLKRRYLRGPVELRVGFAPYCDPPFRVLDPTLGLGRSGDDGT